MGRGTKHKRDWKPTTLQAAIDARRLYTHTVKIMANEKVRDKMDVSILEDSYRCARSCMEEGNSRRLLRSMDCYLGKLKEEMRHGKNVTD